MQIKSANFIFLVLLLSLIAGCSEPIPKETLSIQKVGELRFRRSYADAQFREMLYKEKDSIEKSNPLWYGGFKKEDSVFIEKLKAQNITDKNYNLIRQNFDNDNKKKFSLISDNKVVFCEIKRPVDSDRFDQYDLIIIQGKIKDSTEIEGHYGLMNEEIKYILLDIIPGGYKEIAILNEYYIMNGDNSDVYIYEIK